MRLFALSNFQDIILYLFPTLIFMILFGVGLAYTHFQGKDDREREETVIYRFPDGIEDRDAPFPLMMTLINRGDGAVGLFLHSDARFAGSENLIWTITCTKNRSSRPGWWYSA